MSSLLHHYSGTLRLGLPIAVGQVGVIVMGFADTMMVGHYSTAGLAAASFVNNVFNLVLYLQLGYSYSLTPIVSSCCAQGNVRGAVSGLKHAVVANLLYTLLLVAAMGVLYACLDFLGQPPELLRLIRPYFLIILLSVVFLGVFNAVRQFTDGTGDTLTGMWILLAGNAVNLVGNALFIFGNGPFPEWGLFGAGFATMLSRLFIMVAIVAVVFFGKRYRLYAHAVRSVVFSLRELLHLNAKSLPISLQLGMETATFSLSAIMVGWIGATELAAYQIVCTISMLGFLFYYSFGSASAIRISHFVGLSDFVEARRASSASRNILLFLAACAASLFLTCGNFFARLFTSDAAVLHCVSVMLIVLAIYQLGDAMQTCYAHALRALSRPVDMMAVAFVGYIVVGLPACYILGITLGLGVSGIFAGLALGLYTAAPLFWWRFRRALRRCEG